MDREETPDEIRCRQQERWDRAIAISILVVIASGVLGMVTQDHLFSHRRCGSAPAACIANLKTLDGAKSTWALENHKSTNDVPADSDLFGDTLYIREKPVCPRGGTYTIGPVSERPRCTFPGHTL